MATDDPTTDERKMLLATLDHAIGRSTELAQKLAGDPDVGGEARALLGRLDCVRAEVEVIAAVRSRLAVVRTDEPASPSPRLWH
ncbi:hypothetical protein GCM10022280_07800 [Sphingomonas swuensis]|uniref:Uncharacterized protein n=1 Tax=Sphingomonas swuensis TaxID=977800 RepID=A0ABP7SIZ8_9SPHN